MSAQQRSKKRKLEGESLYGNFVTAANALSALYAQASSQREIERAEGAREALERLSNLITRQYGTDGFIPAGALLDHIATELKQDGGRSGGAPPSPSPPPAPLQFSGAPGGAGMVPGFDYRQQQQQQQQQYQTSVMQHPPQQQ